MANEAIGEWTLNANGAEGTLSIPDIDSAGRLVGAKAFGSSVIGFWDDEGKKITFLRPTKASGHSSDQIYTGYWFSTDESATIVSFYLTGFFEAFEGTGGKANRTLFGWFARTVLPELPVPK